MKNLIIAGCLLACLCIGTTSFTQLKVGRTEVQINTDNAKATPKLIGTNGSFGIMSSEYE